MKKYEAECSKFEAKYANKTLKEMIDIEKKYEEEHPEEFHGSNTRVFSTGSEYAAILRRIGEFEEEDQKIEQHEAKKKMGCLAVLATVLNPRKWFTKERQATPEEIAETEKMLSQLRVEPASEDDLEGRMLKEFRKRNGMGK